MLGSAAHISGNSGECCQYLGHERKCCQDFKIWWEVLPIFHDMVCLQCCQCLRILREVLPMLQDIVGSAANVS